jgi:hypothetical protein
LAELFHDLPSGGFVKGPSFFSGRNDLFRRKEESVNSGVSQLHADRVRDSGDAQSPVHGASGSDVEQTGNAADLVVLAVNGFQSSVGLIGEKMLFLSCGTEHGKKKKKQLLELSKDQMNDG